ncbi:MAG: hypothetical protein LBC13_01180, partial [Clostridiales bacterium]|nr:hypothetical protein [Clostridiales bacterium]
VLLQSTGKKFLAALLFAANFIFIPPFAFLFGKVTGTANVWISFPIAGIAASAIAAITLWAFSKKYKNGEQKKDESAVEADIWV